MKFSALIALVALLALPVSSVTAETLKEKLSRGAAKTATVAKKAAFVQQVAVSLKLPNLRGLHARVESLTDPYPVICSRAFASLPDFVTWSRSALAEGGVWMAMKGRAPTDELAAIPDDIEVFHVEPLSVPGLDAERCLVWMRPKREVPR